MHIIHFVKQDLYNSKKVVSKTPRFLFFGLIVLYQRTLSPDHGLVSIYTLGQCKFRPTCSEYTKRMIVEHGVILGFKMGFQQLRCCHS